MAAGIVSPDLPPSPDTKPPASPRAKKSHDLDINVPGNPRSTMPAKVDTTTPRSSKAGRPAKGGKKKEKKVVEEDPNEIPQLLTDRMISISAKTNFEAGKEIASAGKKNFEGAHQRMKWVGEIWHT